MVTLPVAVCGGSLLYGLTKSAKNLKVFMAVTLNGYSYRFIQQGTKEKPKTGFRCRGYKCAAWIDADGMCKH